MNFETGIQSGWHDSTLGEIGEYVNGRGFKTSEWSERGRMIIRIQDLTGTRKRPNYFAGECDERHVVRSGDLLISWAATLDAFIWNGPEAVLNQHIFKVRSSIDRRFHFYLVKAVLADVRRRAHGTGMVHVTKAEFERTRVRVPISLAEQEAIVAAIDRHLSRLDAAVESLRDALATIRRYRALILEIANGRWEAEGSDGWHELSLGDVLAEPLRNGHSARPSTNGGVRSLTLTAVTTRDFSEANTKLTTADPAAVAPLWLRPGDLLIERANTPELVGTAAMYRGPENFAIFPDLLIRARIRQTVSPDFIELVLRTPSARRYFQGRAKGIAGSMPKIDQQTVAELPLRLPSREDQLRIVATWSVLDDSANHLEVELLKATRRVESLRNQIIRKGLSGEVAS